MQNATNKRDPVTALEDQDARQRKDVLRATRYVLKNLSGDQLRRFVDEAASFLRRFSTNDNNHDPAQEEHIA